MVYFDPESKQQSVFRSHTSSATTKKVQGKSPIRESKVLYTVFLDAVEICCVATCHCTSSLTITRICNAAEVLHELRAAIKEKRHGKL